MQSGFPSSYSSRQVSVEEKKIVAAAMAILVEYHFLLQGSGSYSKALLSQDIFLLNLLALVQNRKPVK